MLYFKYILLGLFCLMNCSIERYYCYDSSPIANSDSGETVSFDEVDSSDNDADEIGEKIIALVNKNNADDSEEDDQVRQALMKRALPRMGRRSFDGEGLDGEDQLKRHLARVERAMPRMGRGYPRMGRSYPRMGRAYPRMGRALPRMG